MSRPGRGTNAPDAIILQFFKATGQPVMLAELGEQFLRENNVEPPPTARQFQIAVERKTSRAQNPYFDYSQTAIPLPDGLDTQLRVEGIKVPMGEVRPSKKGNPTREGYLELSLGDAIFKITAYLTKTRSGYFAKLTGVQERGSRSSTPANDYTGARGGRLA